MRIVIGEDSALFREGLARLLVDAGHTVERKAVDAPSLIAAVEDVRPDLAIIDVRMPPDRTDDGARAARDLRERMPDLGIVLLSQHVETRHSVDLVAGMHFGYRQAVRRWTRRWSARCSGTSADTTRRRRSLPASARCSP